MGRALPKIKQTYEEMIDFIAKKVENMLRFKFWKMAFVLYLCLIWCGILFQEGFTIGQLLDEVKKGNHFYIEAMKEDHLYLEVRK